MNHKEQLIQAVGKFIVVADLADPASITEYTLDGDQGKFVYRGHNDRYKDQRFSKEFCWPVQAKDELIAILTERQLLQKALDRSLGLVYELNNKIARGDIK